MTCLSRAGSPRRASGTSAATLQSNSRFFLCASMALTLDGLPQEIAKTEIVHFQRQFVGLQSWRNREYR